MNNSSTNRKLGAYYTPQHVSKMLCDWAIRSKNDFILEPGFGGCGFLEASKLRLQALGCKQAKLRIYGCDKDKRAFEHLAEKIGPTSLDQRFILSDFMDLRPTNFSTPAFDAVIGNPPYISMHNMSAEQLEKVRQIEFQGIKIEKRASLWAYFIIHGLSFLKIGGRCAWVLPSSYVNTSYAKKIHSYLESQFNSILTVPITERLFTGVGAMESTVILLAEGWQKKSPHSHSAIHYADTSNQLNQIIQTWESNKLTGNVKRAAINPRWTNKTAQKVFTAINDNSQTSQLGDISTIRIGIVTGANKFFILNQSQATALGLSNKALKPIMAKMAQASCLSLTDETLEQNRKADARCLLLNTKGRKLKLKGVESYLATYSEQDIANVATFQKRARWHQPDDNLIPDAFLSYMCNHGPKLILNSAGTTSTNTIHRIYFNQDIDVAKQKLIAISLLTTFSQLSAELVGRSYGSGVLKLEPSEAKQLSITLPTEASETAISKVLIEINNKLQSNKLVEAKQLADEFILKPLLNTNYEQSITLLREELSNIRARRKGI